jgi:hypothetical protein
VGKYTMVVTSGAKDGRDKDYNEWYDNQHIHDICAIPGVTSGRRLDAIPVTPNEQPAPYLAIYEIETDDMATFLAEMGRRGEAGEMPLTDALDIDSAKIWMYKAH